jgi:Carbohydrate esterase, sialic acid-specific acetylesterase
VLLIIGQSNSANHADKKFTTQFPQSVFNYFEGKCYIASSPLLGATGEGGEFITPLADKLISVGAYKSVVIVSSGIGGTPISRWQKDGDLNEMLLSTLKRANQKYKITHVIWHQGESDCGNSIFQ